MPPLVSVIIPTYNSATYLPATLDSVLAQTYKNIEVVIVDDGSTDDTKQIVSTYESSQNLKYIHQSNSGGPSRPRNRGIRESTGEYISLFDSDDLMLPYKIELAVMALIREPRLGMIFTDFAKYHDGAGREDGTFLDDYDRFSCLDKQRVDGDCYIIKGKEAFETLFYENYIGTSGVVIPRDVFTSVGLFDEGLKNSDDHDMWFRITSNYDVGFIDEVCHYYRKRPNSVSSRGVDLIENRIKVIRKQLKHNLNHTTLRQARRLLAENLYSRGYCFQRAGEMKEARGVYVESLKEHVLWRAMRGIIITLLPTPLAGLLKRMRDSYRGGSVAAEGNGRSK